MLCRKYNMLFRKSIFMFDLNFNLVGFSDTGLEF